MPAAETRHASVLVGLKPLGAHSIFYGPDMRGFYFCFWNAYTFLGSDEFSQPRTA